MTPEAKVKKQIKAVLDEFEAWYFMPIGGPFTQAGIPDFVCAVNGLFLGIEAKAEGKISTLTPAQRRTLTLIEQKGRAVTLVCDGSEEKLKELRWILERMQKRS